MEKDIERILFREDEIAAAVKRVGERITEDYAGKNLLLVGILKGSVIFMADLMRAVKLNCCVEFIRTKSYGNSAVSSGKVDILKAWEIEAEGRDVIVIEDILDSARTLYEVCGYLQQKNPASVRTCALLEKKTQRAFEVVPDYKCFDVENEFVVGYGLDYAQRYRNLPYIGVLKKEIYSKHS